MRSMLMLSGIFLLVTGGYGYADDIATLATTATIDTSVREGLDFNNYGADQVLAAATGDDGAWTSAVQYNTGDLRDIFDASYGVNNWEVLNIRLTFTIADPNNGLLYSPSHNGPLGVSWGSNDNWVEGTGTYDSPSSSGLTFDTLDEALAPYAVSAGDFTYDGQLAGSQLHFNLTLDEQVMDDFINDTTMTFYVYSLVDGSNPTVAHFNSVQAALGAPELSVTVLSGPVAVPEVMTSSAIALLLLPRLATRRRSSI